jgi:hypothetical protein
MYVDLFRLCFQIKLYLLLNVTSSFNINGMIFFLNHFLIFYCFVYSLGKSIYLDGFNIVIKFH